jgi:hypothetical protein
MQTSDVEGGLGGATGPRAIRDTRLVERALRERWPIPRPLRGPLIDRLARIVQDPGASPREAISAAKAIQAASRGAARTYLDEHRVNGKLPNRLGLPDSVVILREAIQGYKGGRFWQWNDGTSQWEDRPPNAYVHNVLTHTP